MRRTTLLYLTNDGPRAPRVLIVDVAESPSERVVGLSGIVPARGMVFPHSGERGAEYTMARMLVPIEIYFVGAGGIVHDAHVGHPGTIVRYGGEHLWFVAELPFGTTNLLAKTMWYR